MKFSRVIGDGWTPGCKYVKDREGLIAGPPCCVLVFVKHGPSSPYAMVSTLPRVKRFKLKWGDEKQLHKRSCKFSVVREAIKEHEMFPQRFDFYYQHTEFLGEMSGTYVFAMKLPGVANVFQIRNKHLTLGRMAALAEGTSDSVLLNNCRAQLTVSGMNL